MLDRLPAWLHHFVVMALPIVLAEAMHTWIPWFSEHYGASLAGGIAVTLLTLLCTTLTTAYGVGSGEQQDDEE